MLSADGTVAIIFNGEIYNYRELRDELLRTRSVSFRGGSDTEVIIALYQAHGERVFEKLNGMFAIALYDAARKKIVLARDRLGKKPLYYALAGNTLVFGSEPKALLAHPQFKKKLSLSALDRYLQYEYVPTPHAIFEGMHKLEPATYAVWQDGKLSKREFWRMSFSEHPVSFSEAKKTLDQHLARSVGSRLISDVPLGVFLSGGIDSSTVAYYAQKNSTQKIKTFSIGFTESSFDESSFARTVAQSLGTDHREHMLSAKDSLDLIPRVADLLDEPMADPSILPTYLLSRFTREHVTVALGGDGGDEVFAGYPTFQAFKLAAAYNRLPAALKKTLIEPLVNLLPVSERNMSAGFLVRRFIAGSAAPQEYRNQFWLGAFSAGDRKKLLSGTVLAALQNEKEFSDIDRYRAELASKDPFHLLQYTYLRTYMMDEVLVKVDRASMYNSLEVRAPLLDYQLVDFANGLPFSYKLHGWRTKYILKELMRDKLPRDIVYRKKKGFGIPLTAWLRNELRPLLTDLLSPDRLKRQGLFNPLFVQELIKEHLDNRADRRKELWTLLVFQMWYDRWAN